MDGADPREKWRQPPPRVRPEDMVVEIDTCPYDSSAAADDDAERREARWLMGG